MKGNCYVCVIVGDSCCTYVPDNDADGHLIDQEIRNITKAVDKMTSRERNRDDWNWNLSFVTRDEVEDSNAENGFF